MHIDPTPTGKGQMSRAEIEKRLLDIEERGGTVRISSNGADWLTLSVAMLSIFTTIGAWVWWGGRLSQRMDSMEEWRRYQDTKTEAASTEAIHQSSDIAVIKSQVADVKAWVDRQESKR